MESTISSIPMNVPIKSYSYFNTITPEYINLQGLVLSTSYDSVTLASIYKCPIPPPNKKTAIAIVSFGGGVFGNIDGNGIVTNGDYQAYWTWQGIATSNHPTVQVKFLNGATNDTASGETAENTLDVEMIGSWYPSSNLTICMYITKILTYNDFFNIFTQATTSTINVQGSSILPSCVSVSWDSLESPNYNSMLSGFGGNVTAALNYFFTIDRIFSNAAANGINVCVSSGDHEATDGTDSATNTSLNMNWFSSSQWCISCGGTTLSSKNNIYDANTVEVVWNNSNTTTSPTWGTGGGVSLYYPQPLYQSTFVGSFLNTSYRCAPDIALSADVTSKNCVVTYSQGNYYFTGGTSVVAPCMAAFIATLNINYFFNTKLYKLNSNCLHDITVGNNRPLANPTLGYDARIGYDLCTGRGSIIGTTMSTAMHTYVPPSNIQFTNILSNFGYFSTVKVPFYSTLSNTKWYDSSGNLTIPPTTNIPFSFFQNKMCRF